MFGSASSKTFRPKYQKSKGSLPFPATFNRIQRLKKFNLTTVAFVVLLVWFFWNPFGLLGNIFHKNTAVNYPASHPLTSKHIIESTSKYLYPPIEDASLLRELGVSKLLEESQVRSANNPDIEKTLVRSLNIYDDPDAKVQQAKEEKENALSDLAKAKNRFKNQDKIVYKPKNPKNYPEIIIVTAVDFEKYSPNALIKIVQNRVDYAHNQNYGVYVRWYQEFLPIFNTLSAINSKETAKWIRLHCLRAAMFAFPEAKYFWYIDQDSLIMDKSINLKDYLLSPEALNPIILREQPIIPPDGEIKTYRNSNAEQIKLLVTQSENKVESHSLIVENDSIGRSIIEIWTTDYYMNYQNFPYGPDSALTHILQWHPFILSKTGIIPARTIAARHTDVDLPLDGKAGDHIHYYEGDLVAHWSDCANPTQCESFVDMYHDKLKNQNKEKKP